jgi:hypothetical protein
VSDAYQRLVAEIDQAAIEKAGDECWRQFISHPPKRSDFVGGFVVGALWMLAEKADAIAERDRLRTFIERLTAGVCTCEYMRLFTPVLTRIGVKCQHCEATAVLAEAKP